MREQVEQIGSYVREAWRFRWYALGVAWLVALAGWAVSLQMPNEYRASAQIHVDTESMLKPLLRGLVVESNTQRRVELMTRTLLARPNLEKVARETDLDLRAESPQQMEALIDRLERRIQLSGTGRTNLYRISYRGEDPQVTRDVVDTLVNLFVEESMGRTRRDTESAQAFLNRKVEEYERRVAAAEQRLTEFKREHVGQLPGNRGDYYQRLQQATEQLEQARFELETAQSRKRELEKQLAGEEPVFGIMGDQDGGASTAQTPRLDQRINKLQDRLDQLLLKYTEQHPEVETVRDRLEQLTQKREEKRAELAAAAGEASPREGSESLEQNPVHQEIRAALARTRAEVATAESKVARYRRQVQELRSKVNTLPEVEARYNELQRQHQQVKQTYDELQQRLRTAEISEAADSAENQVDFRVVEPARVPSEPVAPDRPLLVTASLGAAAVGYGAFAVFLALLWPTFHTRAAVHSALQMPVLGAIAWVPTHSGVRRRRLGLAAYGLALAVLLAAYGVALLLAMGADLPAGLQGLRGLF